MLAAGFIGLAAEGWRRSWLGVAAWLCVVAGGALRITPTPIPMSEWIDIALPSVFLVLMLVRFVIRRRSLANGTTALPR
jgi:hypothetical protein